MNPTDTTPDPFACACDVESPVCACLPLWVETTGCPTCRSMGLPRNCPPKECYCGHPECPAYLLDRWWTRKAQQ